MGAILSIDEILQFAITIETKGEEFYRTNAAGRTGQVAEIFLQLANDEARHRAFFAQMLAGITSYQPPQAYPDEYFQYLRAYADQTVFSDRATRTLADSPRPTDVLDFAIGRELASIAYYSELRSFLGKEHHPHLEKVVQEERSHFLRLTQLRKSL